MKYLFIFNITPSKKIIECLNIKITLTLISLIYIIYGVLNFMGLFNWEGAENDLYFYLIHITSIIFPLMMNYTAFFKNVFLQNLAFRLHTYQVILIILVYVILIITFFFYDRKVLMNLLFALIIQGIFDIFSLFANYVYFIFNHYYAEIYDISPNNTADSSSLLNN